MGASPCPLSRSLSFASSWFAITIFVSFAVRVHTSIPKQLPLSPLRLFTPSLTTGTLFITTYPSVRSPGSNRSRTLLNVGLLLSNSQIQSHHSHPPVSTLAKHKWAHWIQAPLTYLQSSHNHPTFISAWPHHSSAFSQHSLFIFGHTRSPIHIGFRVKILP